MGNLNGIVFIKMKRNDGRKYKGEWKNGKQHGEGEYKLNENSNWKRGFWSEGKRVRWINNQFE